MKKQSIAVLLLLSATFMSRAQEQGDIKAFAKAQKALVLHAYAHNDATACRKAIDDFVTRYNTLPEKDRSNYNWYVENEYYLLASIYAVNNDKNNALDFLEKSQNYDYDELVHDHDMDNLRKDDRFKKFLAESKSRTSYTALLQSAPAYNTGVTDDLPAFTYQAATDSNLMTLKKAFNLDSIAGKGNDISQIINLMEWVHYQVLHDGSKGNPKVKNALAMITDCKKHGKTLNCRGLAIILNEVYLAEGFKSRFVTCYPKDTTDKDCHVIDIVWSTSLRKWVWMDPTFMAYVMDDKGEVLGIAEVRQRMIDNKPLILNPDANRNHAISQTHSDYLGYYMAKNLYKMGCPIESRYNYETPEAGKTRMYIQLLPGNTKPATEQIKDKQSKVTFTAYYTNNPDQFWAPPAGEPTGREVFEKRDQAAYEQVMGRFKNFYNDKLADSVVNMFSDPADMKSFYTQQMQEELMKDYGRIISFKYMAMEDSSSDVALFKMVCEKSVHMMGISINEKNKLGTFRFETSSPFIDKLLAKEK